MENVCYYPRPPALEPVAAPVRIEFAGRMVAATDAPFRVLETTHPPAYYLPREDFTSCTLSRRAAAASASGRAGPATGRSRRRRVAMRAAWSYPDPAPAYAAIRDHLAVYAGSMDRCSSATRRSRRSPVASTAAGSPAISKDRSRAGPAPWAGEAGGGPGQPSSRSSARRLAGGAAAADGIEGHPQPRGGKALASGAEAMVAYLKRQIASDLGTTGSAPPPTWGLLKRPATGVRPPARPRPPRGKIRRGGIRQSGEEELRGAPAPVPTRLHGAEQHVRARDLKRVRRPRPGTAANPLRNRERNCSGPTPRRWFRRDRPAAPPVRRRAGACVRACRPARPRSGPDPRRVRQPRHAGEPPAVVLHRQHDRARVRPTTLRRPRHPHLHHGAAGVAVRVAESLLGDPEEGRLGVAGQPAIGQLGRHIDGDREAGAPREPLRVPAQRRRQPHLIEQRRMEEIGERPDLALTLLDEGHRLLDGVIRVIREARRDRTNARGGEARADEDLRRAVVQLARDAPPLVVLQRQQPGAEAAKRRLGRAGLR